MRRLHIDFETFAAVDVGEVGVHQLVRDTEFAVTVIAWAFDEEPVQSVVWPYTTTLPMDVYTHIFDGGTVCAHNASFEYTVLKDHYGFNALRPEQMDCTMNRATVVGLPAALLDAGRAMSLSILKDETEEKLMKTMARPQFAPAKKGVKGARLPNLHESQTPLLRRLEAYCQQDVRAERALDAVLPALSDFERAVSLIDAKSNERGVMLDLVAVQALLDTANMAQKGLRKEASALTGGLVTNPAGQHDKIREWLRVNEGLDLPDLSKERVAELLALEVLSADARRLLELRQLAAKSSTAKLDKMLVTAGLDYRSRGGLQYYGASRTGRWAGRLIQVQNLPRPQKGINPEAVIEAAVRDRALEPLVFGSPLNAISKSLRGCIVAGPGMTLVSLDLAQIEARVLAWLAGQDDVVEAFRAFDQKTGPDIYVYAAQKLGSQDRQLGKVTTLSAGYGVGVDKFRLMAAQQYGLVMSREEAEARLKEWQTANPKIKSFWWALQGAARLAMGYPDRVNARHRPTGPLGGFQQVGRYVTMEPRGTSLRINKPGGGGMYYHKARYDKARDEFLYMGVNQKTKAWQQLDTYGGKLTENITSATARDIMAEALVRVEAMFGLVPIMTVHDEAVYEVPEGFDPRIIHAAFVKVPRWAAGLPIASDMKTGRRYSK